MSAQKNKMWFRTKRFFIVLAGPLANILLALIAWRYLPSDGLFNWDFERRLVPVQLFIWANLITGVANLWPSTGEIELGKVHSDGRALTRVFSLRPKSIDRSNALYYAGKAAACTRKEKYQEAQSWLQNGLDRFPDNPTLLLYSSINLVNLKQFPTAREIALEILARKDLTPPARYLVSNNLAYIDLLLEDPALLDEADRYSRETINNIPWKAYAKGTRGSVLVELGRIDEGIQLLQSAIKNAETKKHKALNYCWLAMAEAKRGNFADSKTYLATARRLDPDCLLTKRTLRYIEGSVSAAREKPN